MATLEWNQNQLKIAKLLTQGHNPQDVRKMGYSSKTVYKILHYIEAGGELPSLDDAFIAQAKPPTPFEEYTKKKKESAKHLPATVVGKAGAKKPKDITDALTKTTYLSFIPMVQQLPLTPDIYMSYLCALHKGYRGELVDWISLVSRDFWLGREINFYAIVGGVKETEEKEETSAVEG